MQTERYERLRERLGVLQDNGVIAGFEVWSGRKGRLWSVSAPAHVFPPPGVLPRQGYSTGQIERIIADLERHLPVG